MDNNVLTKSLLAVGVIGVVAYIGLTYSSTSFTTTTTELQEFKDIDKLYTTFLYIPIIDYKFDYLKRDMYNKIYETEGAKKVVQGYCFRQYDIGIGYDGDANLFANYQEAVCKGAISSLPEPIILSSHSIDADAIGEYSQNECESWDFRRSDGGSESKDKIIQQLIQDGQWDGIVNSSREILASFIKINCSTVGGSK